MSRLVNIDSTGKDRQRLRRTIAEALHRLMKKQAVDSETLDLAALIVFALREIEAGIERSATAWDKRHYYIRADRLRADWEWSGRAAERVANLLVAEDWSRLPLVLADRAPRFADVRVKTRTRPARLWRGAYSRLLEE